MIRDLIPAAAYDRCKSCNAEIVWAATGTNLRTMIVDVEPASGGNVALQVTGDGKLLAVTQPASRAFGRQDLHLPHFVTCPHADTRRRRRTRTTGGRP